MKKLIVLFLMLALSGSIVHAGIFDWVTGMFVSEEEKASIVGPLPTVYEEIVGKVFQHASWECYDGATSVSQDAVCLPAEVWHKKAESDCGGHCYQDGSKCGVNSFSVLTECGDAVVGVVQSTATGVSPSPATEFPQTTTTESTPQVAHPIVTGTSPATEVVQSTASKVVQPAGTEVAQPTAIGVVQSTATGISQSADLDELKEEMRKSQEITRFCMDSCPSNKQCYPFGYRKEEKFCSDTGTFTDQLQENSDCDNNFECSTNVCVDGKCVSSSLIQKIVNWLNKLLG